jgi:hypothetical protein
MLLYILQSKLHLVFLYGILYLDMCVGIPSGSIGRSADTCTGTNSQMIGRYFNPLES